MIRAVYFTVEETERLEQRAAERRVAFNFLVRSAVRRELGLQPIAPPKESPQKEEAQET